MSVKHLLKMMSVSNLSQPSQILVGEVGSLLAVREWLLQEHMHIQGSQQEAWH
jgi:hypothetical protein